MKKYEPFLTEMSFSRKKIKDEMTHHFYTINEHIVKLLLFPEEKDKHRGWKDSIRKTIGKIGRMKSKDNSFLKEEDYYVGFFIEPYENNDNYKFLDSLVDDVLFDYSDLKTDWDLKLFPKERWIESIKLFFKDVSIMISRGKYNNSDLINLIKKYFKA